MQEEIHDLYGAVETGKTYAVRYPFCRDKAFVPGEECEVDTWRPGTRFEHIDDDVWSMADGHGEMLLTVVDVHKPGKYPTRVFFTRQWKDPEGKVFGKGKLHITTQQAFKSLMKGYRHHYEQPE